jgi:ubiquitin thioesterase OTU1
MTMTKLKRVRIRHAGGSSFIEVAPKSTIGDVAKLIEAAVPSMPHSQQVWKTNYPPRPIPYCNERDAFVATDVIHVSVGDRGFIYFERKEPVVMDPEGIIVKRVMDADNSCLFNSIGYVLCNKSRMEAPRLRQAIAKAIQEDPVTFTVAFLGQSPQEYIDFITNNNSWGGQIELHVFSLLFQTEIAALDIIRDRVDIYGTEGEFKKRAFVIYDGIHYDALAFAYDEWLPESQDVTLFSPKDDAVLQKALRLCSDQHKKKAFTDTSNFTLRCAVCQVGFVGAVQAQEHAKTTGHQNFVEFR